MMNGMDNVDDLLVTDQLVKLFPNTSYQYWALKRHKGGGPPYIKIGGKIFYPRADLETWLNSHKYTRTDQPVTP